MLGDPRSHGLWERTAPPAPPTRPLEREIAADVAVVGGGYTGCSAALHLAEGGARVAVLEAEEIGFGGSGRNVGLVNAGLWVMPDDVPRLLGEVHGERLLTLLGAAPRAVFDLVERHGIACEPETAGTLHLAVGPAGAAEIAARAAEWQRRGADVELIDAAETAGRTGSSLYAGALLDRRAGTIQPLAYVRGLAGAAIAAGASIFTKSPVTAYARDGAGWRVETPSGSVRARWIVVATNAYTSNGANAPWSAIREEIVHLPYFNIATKPLSSNLARAILPERQGCWDTKTILSSFRLDRAGRLVIGSVGALRGSGASVHRSWARRSLARVFPQLGEIEFEAEWYGKIGMTADAVPRFHRLAENVVSFSGYNGRGIAPGTVFGAVLARHILGQMPEEALPLPVTEPAAQSFRGLREAWYEAGAQIAHLSSRV
ncbi:MULTISPECIES: NAD(P)/FAD-dependent oxidoreductase [unclassified Aureimonas]|uniref:NAD(P)/FAD-dependent oxidoreductase n=1 Tax=unclassified Aureimonas TaxID=2615206 RepID=UPI0006F2597D|nr:MULTISPECIES: FAD-binding oxidoreductase [unclassified Aureimonas]KQT64444.1 FAD-dependent oxidoreductase [Aureimonas sp. Leaf427]KQT81632.1 FAD-dependent oxidoreductase [Aureimonas sp. Leaf460]